MKISKIEKLKMQPLLTGKNFSTKNGVATLSILIKELQKSLELYGDLRVYKDGLNSKLILMHLDSRKRGSEDVGSQFVTNIKKRKRYNEKAFLWSPWDNLELKGEQIIFLK